MRPTSLDAGRPTFVRGDLNLDGLVTLADAPYLFDFLYLDGPEPRCEDAADTDDNGTINVEDVYALLDCLYPQGDVPNLPPPFKERGPDPTTLDDDLGCDAFRLAAIGEGYGNGCQIVDALHQGQQDEEFFYSTTTPGPIDSFSFSYIVDDSTLSLVSLDGGDSDDVRVDFEGTAVFPDDDARRQQFEASEFFRVSLEPSAADPEFSHLRVGALFVERVGDAFRRLPSPVTLGRLNNEPLLRLVVYVEKDTPLTEKGETRGVMTPADPPPGGLGAQSEFIAQGAFNIAERECLFGSQVLSGAGEFLRGDSNNDGEVNISDASFTLSFLFLGDQTPACKDATDVNDSGTMDLADAVYTLSFLFQGTAAPPGPFPVCGQDVVGDDLLPICLELPHCE